MNRMGLISVTPIVKPNELEVLMFNRFTKAGHLLKSQPFFAVNVLKLCKSYFCPCFIRWHMYRKQLKSYVDCMLYQLLSFYSLGCIVGTKHKNNFMLMLLPSSNVFDPS